MYKLVILIELPEGDPLFENQWPNFLRYAEKMPGLVKEATSRVSALVYGSYACSMVHELFFESRSSLEQAMKSHEGTIAGGILQRITRGKVTLFFAEHHEDVIENLQEFTSGTSSPGGEDGPQYGVD